MIHVSRSARRLIVVSLLLVAALVTDFGTASAMPPHPDLARKIRAGSVAAPKFLRYGSCNLDGPDKPATFAAKRLAGEYTGPFNILCILVDFTDNPHAAASTYFDSLIYDGGPGTVRHYYDEVSYSKIDIVSAYLPSAVGWQQAPQTYAYYVDSAYGLESAYPHNTRKLVEDLVDQVDSAVDFSDYDNDGDGKVDVVMIVHAGTGAEYSGSRKDIWSHKWSISARSKDGVYVQNYTIMPEFWNNPGDMTIGVFCHELAHGFGLPDLYDVDYSSQGTGRWSLMSSGSWNGWMGNSPAHLDPWCKTQLGWVNPINVVTNQIGAEVPQVEFDPTVYRLWSLGSQGNEYFLAENRQLVGYDSELPGAGLLIWHIDDLKQDNTEEWYPGHTTSGHYLIALEQADNLFELEQNLSGGNAGDPFPGSSDNRTFSEFTNPSSDSYVGTSTLVAISDISGSQSTMTADFVVSLASSADDDGGGQLPRIDLGQNYPNPFNPVTWIDFTIDQDGAAEMIVYNILGERVATIASGYFTAGTHTITWDGTSDTGQELASGLYFYELHNLGRKEVKKMLLLK
jgi:immune inhibitor A